MDNASAASLQAPLVFLAHSHGDKAIVREFYELLRLDGFAPWLDEESLIAGQDWEVEVEASLKRARAIVVFLSSRATDSAGYVHKEISVALKVAERLPTGSILVVPLKLDDCVVPRALQNLHWLDFSRVRLQQELSRGYKGGLGVEIETLDFALGEKYLRLRAALLASEGSPSSLSETTWSPWAVLADGDSEGKGFINYLVRGQTPSGTRYSGLATVTADDGRLRLRSTIGLQVWEYEGEPSLGLGSLRFAGKHRVEYWMIPRSWLLVGEWDEGGREELIPARNQASPW